MRNVLDTAFEFDYSVVDLATNSTTVVADQCIVRGLYVNETLSGQDLEIKDGATAVFTIPAFTTIGTWMPLGDVHFTTSLVVDPDDSATGSITVIYKTP